VPNYFLDTSALAKLYHHETGSDYMDRILEQRGARSLISRLSIVEFESVLAMKIRTGEIDQPALQIARRRFKADLARQRLIVAPPVHEGHFQSARKLLVQYGVGEGLRTLDALQLAVALDLHRLEHIAVLVAADQRLCRVSSLAGCTAINPEQPNPILI
jgi:predicted nucleic acid-binding protein